MAVQRTLFPNERTLMAYLRTAITITAGGFAAPKLTQHVYIEVIGLPLIPMGLVVAVSTSKSSGSYSASARIMHRPATTTLNCTKGNFALRQH